MEFTEAGRPTANVNVLNKYIVDSSFEEILSYLTKSSLLRAKNKKILKASCIDTPLGTMVAIGDEQFLYFLEFIDHHKLKGKIEKLCRIGEVAVVLGCTQAIDSIQNELAHYFEGNLKIFKTPLFLLGTPFQKQVWEQLLKISYARTCSYSSLAALIERPSAFRAVAQANGANRLPIIIPCHRVINTGGALGGYSGGLTRKQWLLSHEQYY